MYLNAREIVISIRHDWKICRSDNCGHHWRLSARAERIIQHTFSSSYQKVSTRNLCLQKFFFLRERRDIAPLLSKLIARNIKHQNNFLQNSIVSLKLPNVIFCFHKFFSRVTNISQTSFQYFLMCHSDWFEITSIALHVTISI